MSVLSIMATQLSYRTNSFSFYSVFNLFSIFLVMKMGDAPYMQKCFIKPRFTVTICYDLDCHWDPKKMDIHLWISYEWAGS